MKTDRFTAHFQRNEERRRIEAARRLADSMRWLGIYEPAPVAVRPAIKTRRQK